MCIAGDMGAKINTNLLDEERIKFLFGEDQSRYLIEINQKNLQSLIEMAKNQEITLMQIGVTQSNHLEIDEMNISVKELQKLIIIGLLIIIQNK
jgi:phosphoribosylformylglycinamidine (FGAM) synthase-like enzyme